MGRRVEIPAHIREAAGFIATRPSAPDGTLVTVYDAREQGSEADGGRWMIVCEAHCALVQVTNRRHALAIMRDGSESFCACCANTCTDALFARECPSCGKPSPHAADW